MVIGKFRQKYDLVAFRNVWMRADEVCMVAIKFLFYMSEFCLHIMIENKIDYFF